MGEKQRKVLSIKLPNDTYKHVETYREQHDISKSEAGRRLIRDSLKTEASGESNSIRDRTITALVVALVLLYPTLAAHSGRLDLALAYIAFASLVSLFGRQLDAAWTQLKNLLPGRLT